MPDTLTTRPFNDLDISSVEFWGKPPQVRDETFKTLRDKGGVTWHPPVEAQPNPPIAPGFWAVTKHARLVEVSQNPQLFSSSGTSPILYDADPEMVKASASFGGMDAPEHTRFRRLVSKAFSPGQLRRIDELIARHATVAVDDLLAHGPCDFVEVVSNYVPSAVITDMLGIQDEGVRRLLVEAVTSILAFGDPRLRREQAPMEFFATKMLELHAAGYAHVAERRSHPSDDLMTALIDAEVDGERLTDTEIVSVFSALSIAGIDTTRNTLTFGLRALTEFEEQRKMLMEDLPGRIDATVIEMVRYASPVGAFVRRATEDTELGGVRIARNDRVALFYMSANRDEDVFTDPWQFDIGRDNAKQVGWGGGGPHYCLGANLAKVELRDLFTELLTRIPTIRAVGSRFTPRHRS